MELLLLLLFLLWRTQIFFWSNLIALNAASNSRYIRMGGFNKVLNQSEKKCDLLFSIWLNRLRDSMDDSQVMDIGSKRLLFTWLIREKEDTTLNNKLIEY